VVDESLSVAFVGCKYGNCFFLLQLFVVILICWLYLLFLTAIERSRKRIVCEVWVPFLLGLQLDLRNSGMT